MVATTLDMRYKTRELLDSIARGVQVIITYRGKKTCVLSPYKEAPAVDCGSVCNHPFFASAVGESESVEAKMNVLRGGRFDDL
jgi:antitoxin (DNA-binding transcriptional repressor) of toxin-antitoxin stability system